MKEMKLLKKVFPVTCYVTNRSKKITAKKPNDYEGYKQEEENYYVEMINYPIYKRQLSGKKGNFRVDIGEMNGVYGYDPNTFSIPYQKLTTLDSVFLKYNPQTGEYKEVQRIVQNHSKEDQIEMDIEDNISEYWDISQLSENQQAEIDNVLGEAIDTFKVNDNIYVKQELENKYNM